MPGGKVILVLADAIRGMEAFPWLWVPHCLVMNLSLLDTVGGSDLPLKNPLSTFILGILYTYPGAILSSLFLGRPPFEFLTNTRSWTTMVLSWYLVIYSPMFRKLLKALKLVDERTVPTIGLTFLQDILRLKNAADGVETINATHPGLMAYSAAFAAVKSSSFMFVKYLENLVLKGSQVGAFTVPNYHSKTCLLASILFSANATGFLPMDKALLFVVLVALALVLRLEALRVSWKGEPAPPDPYCCGEEFICNLALGHRPDQKQTKKD